MYAQKMIIYPDGSEKSGIRTDFFDLSAIFVSFFTTLFLIKLVFEETAAPLGFGICIVYLAFLIFTTFYILSRHKKFPLKAVFPFVLCVVSALSIGFHCYTISAIIPFLFYLSGLYCISLTCSKGTDYESYTDLYIQLRSIVFIPVSKLFTPVISIVKNTPKLKNKKYLSAVLGVVCGIPVFLIVLKLLMAGDAAFDNAMTDFTQKLHDLFSFGDDYLTSIFFVPTLIFSPYIMATIFVFRHGIVKSKTDTSDMENSIKNLRFVPSSALCGFYGIVAVCYILYLISQFTYLFSAFSGEVPEGMSVSISDYARRGFFEMSAVAFINLVLIGFGAVCSKREKGDRINRYYKLFCLFFCLFTMVLIITAMSKMALYISSMGLTDKRIIVSLCDIVLFISFLSVFIRLFNKKFPYMKVIMYTFLVITTAYFAVSTEAVITSYNTNAYLSGRHKEIDLDYISYECSWNNDYFAIKNLDKIAQSDKECANAAKCEVYSIYSNHKRHFSDTADSVSDYLLLKYIKENESRIETYLPYYEDVMYSLNSYPYVYDDYIEDIIVLTVENESEIDCIRINYDFYEMTYSEYDFETAENRIYITVNYEADSELLSRFTVVKKDGTESTCDLVREGDNTSRYYTLTDDGKGGFMCVQS